MNKGRKIKGHVQYYWEQLHAFRGEGGRRAAIGRRFLKRVRARRERREGREECAQKELAGNSGS